MPARMSHSALRVFVALMTLMALVAPGVLLAQEDPPPDFTLLKGTVYDSVAGGPVVAATVHVQGPSQLTLTTGRDGTFLITALPAGDYQVTASYPRADSLGVFFPVKEVHLQPGVEVSVELASPSLSTVQAEVCRSGVPGTGVLIGTVKDVFTKVVMPEAKVTVSWWDADRGRRSRVDLATGLERRDFRLRIARSGRVIGRITDYETGKPVEAALVTVGGTFKALTGQDGRFEIEDVPRGPHVISIEHLGYEPVFDTLVVEKETIDVTARVSAHAIVIEGITVSVRAQALELVGFFDRKEESFGSFIDRKEMEEGDYLFVRDALLRVPGLRLVPRSGVSGGYEVVLRQRCRPVYVVDGIQMPRGMFTLEDLLPDDVLGIEIYRSEIDIPPQYAKPIPDRSAFGITGTISTPCGAILIWTR